MLARATVTLAAGPAMPAGHEGMPAATLDTRSQAAVDTPWLAVEAVASTVAAGSAVVDTAVVVDTGKI
jgi:hypothetical protein